MKLAILGPGKKFVGYTTERLLEEAKKEFRDVELIPVINVNLKTDKGISAVYGKKDL